VDVLRLPAGFRFGTITSAYQVEGAVREDDRGDSIWDRFAQRPGAIVDGSDASVACDSYHRYPEDIELLRRLGVDSHRFSFSWSRFQHDGRGPLHPKAVDHYDRYVDALLEAGIAPMATLCFYDLPQALEEDGGWLNRSTADAFGEYAHLVGTRFADRVASWVPLQEPNAHAYLGYDSGEWAPGRKLVFGALPASHHMLLGHGRAVSALRAAGARSVGCANNHAPMWPMTEDPADVGASKLFDSLWNGLFLEAMLLGRYPVDLEVLADGLVQDGDLATIRQPLDFYGVNYYHPLRIAAAPEPIAGQETQDATTPFVFAPLLGYPTTDTYCPVVPSGLREWLILIRARFRSALPPIVITENSASYRADPDAAGVVDDQRRIDFLSAHLEAVAEACARGVDVRGYYVGDLLDGWDWDYGYTQRFGLVHVDHATGTRTPKRSFEWYAGFIAAHQGEQPGERPETLLG
jgi:beta-glucosidase